MTKQDVRPNLFIVGAAKSGTTSLWYHLKEHDNVFMPPDELYKEPAFFSIKGKWLTYKNYIDIFQSAEKKHKWIGEASTAYLTDETSAKRIYDFNSQAKIIIVLRNPADRAYSLYNWMVQDGYEYLNSFKKALTREDERINKRIPDWFEPEYYWNYLYFRSGLYFNQVNRYLELFGENVLVLKFEELRTNFNKKYKDICLFLDLTPNTCSPEIINKSHQVYSAQIQFILRKSILGIMKNNKSLHDLSKSQLKNKIINLYISNARKLFKEKTVLVDPFKSLFVISKLKQLIKKGDFDLGNIDTKNQRDFLLKTGIRNKPPKKLNSKLKKELLSAYEEDIVKLGKLVNMQFNNWMSSALNT